MELKTEMEGGCVHALGFCVDDSNVHPKAAEHLQHDAAYAHALVRAIAEIESLGPYEVRTKYNGEEMIQSIRGMACRLMHDWGFEERARS